MSDVATRLTVALADRYRVERKLGEGGMATVFLAQDLRHDRLVALKVLRPELAAVVGAERFLAEIKTTAKLQHPNLLPLFDSGVADGLLFYVMPFVDGESLEDRLRRDRQLPVDEAVRIAAEVADGLAYAHSRGVIHRDIKPANILLQAGRPVISDLGIALAIGSIGSSRLTETGMSLGTPHYMSPEQATGELTITAATDIYALGCVLYEMLVGEPPFSGATAQAILAKILAGSSVSVSAQRRSVPTNVDAAIQRALEKVPADRWASAREFAEAIRNPAHRHAGPSQPPHAKRKWLTLRDVAFMVVGAVLGIAGLAGGLAAVGYFFIGPPGFALVWVDRDGNEVPLPIPPGPFTIPRVSPDGSRVAVSVMRDGGTDLWVYDADSGAGLRLTHEDGQHRLPIWSPDGALIYFSSTVDMPTTWGNLYAVPADGSGPPIRITREEVSQAATGITPDGRTLIYSVVTAAEVWDIMAAPSDGSGSGTTLVGGSFRRGGTGDVSPDGRSLAYRSDDTGAFEIYVQAFPGPSAKVPVSIGGGNEPVWSADGRELFYRRPDGVLMAAAIAEGPQVISRTELFDATLYRTGGSNPREYHVAPDGRFLMQRLTLSRTGGGVLGDAMRSGFREGAVTP